MQINPQFPVGLVPTVAFAKAAAARPHAQPAPDFVSKEGLDAGLRQAPELRAEILERAAGLIRSPDYPSAAQLNRLASFLAEHLQAESSPDSE
jgi:hypothetical protein